MPKYWGKQIFSLGNFLKVGQKQKTEKKKLRHNTVVESSGYCPQLSYISLGPMQFAACSGDRC